MPHLIWSPSSRRDLMAIEAFLDERDPHVARDTLRAIQRVIRHMLDYPRIGRAVHEPFRVFGVRGTPYLVIYRLHGADVEIVRIRHGRENWLGQIEAEL
jgi:toxin ParE1/3/4